MKTTRPEGQGLEICQRKAFLTALVLNLLLQPIALRLPQKSAPTLDLELVENNLLLLLAILLPLVKVILRAISFMILNSLPRSLEIA